MIIRAIFPLHKQSVVTSTNSLVLTDQGDATVILISMFKRLHGLVLFVYCIIISIIPSLSGKNQGALSEEKTFTIYDADDSGGIGRKELECLFSDRSITEDLDAWTSEILYQHINDR